MLKTYSRKRTLNKQLQKVHELCRLCLNACNDYAPIFNETSSGCELTPLACKISICIGIQLLVHDNLPNKICQKCFQEIEGYYAFRKKCNESWQRLCVHLKSVEPNLKVKTNHLKVDTNQKEKERDHKEGYGVQRNDNNLSKDIASKDITEETKVDLSNISFYVNNESKAIQNHNQTIILNNVVGDSNIDEIVLLKNSEYREESQTNLESNEDKECKIKLRLKTLAVQNEKEIAESEQSPLQSQQAIVSETAQESSLHHVDPVSEESDKIQNLYVSEVVSEVKEPVSEQNIEHQKINQSSQAELPQFLTHLLEDLRLMTTSGDESHLKLSPIAVQLVTKDETVVLDVYEEDIEEENISNVVRNKKSNVQNASLVCKLCKKLFKSKSSLTRHTKIHFDERPFECNQCLKTFSQYSVMKRHQSLHSENRPFKCSSCERSFSQLANLQFHERSHANTKEYEIHVCPKCSKTFLHASGLSRHMKSAHQGRLYPCVTCLRPFSDVSALRRHVNSHHKNKDNGNIDR